MPKVSVIVPVYNVERYIRKCLDSLVNQTLDDIEIIVINDGSPDNSEKIILEYQKANPDKLTYYKKENGGLSDARNYGITYAKGEYIAFLDSDDYIEYNMYELMYEKAKKEDADMVECDFFWEYPDKTKQDIGIIYQSSKEMLINARVVAWNKLIKTEIIKKTGITFPKGLRYEDIEFFYKILPYIKIVSFIKKPMVHYIQREDSIANTQTKKTEDIFKILDNVIKYYKEKELFEKYKEELEYVYTRYLLCSSFLRMVHIGEKDIRNQVIKQTWENLNTSFPEWKENKILNETKSKKNFYMKTINKITIQIYKHIFRFIK